MKIVMQRVLHAKVEVEGACVGSIGHGLLVFLGVTHDDTEDEVEILTNKLIQLRIFEDAEGKMNRSLLDISGEVLLVSQFTLYADCSSGRRPSFIQAAMPERANMLYECFAKSLSYKGVKVEKGVFGADMKVSLLNEGPVTIILEKKKHDEV